MLEVRPFRGIRYNVGVVGDLHRVVAPPYDVISEQEQEQLYQASPYNIVRIDLSKDEPGRGDKYGLAGQRFREWLRQGVLVREAQPAFYPYQQEYEVAGSGRRVRWGLTGLVRLASYGEGIVYPHERTLAKPREDRLRLMRATQAQLSPVFGLHFGAAASLDSLLEQFCTTEPACEVRDPAGVCHRLWVLTDPDPLRQLQEALASARVVLADGHHRYETALAYRDERRAAAAGGSGTLEGGPEKAAWNYVLMVLVDLESPGLTVWPTHRILRGIPGFDAEKVREQSSAAFHWEPVSLPGNGRGEAWEAALASLGSHGGFGVYAGNGAAWLVRLRDPRMMDKGDALAHSEQWRRLDVAILHTLLLQDVLGLDAGAQERGEHLVYTRSTEEALAAVDKGEGQAAFLLRPTPPAAVRDVALAGDTLPQKSTYFYPKLLTGLVLSDLA